MNDAASRAIAEVSETEFDNVEFIGEALQDPLNVLRVKLKEISQISEEQDVAIRRVIVITDYSTSEGRSLGIMFSNAEHESDDDAEDSVIATLARLQASMLME